MIPSHLHLRQVQVLRAVLGFDTPFAKCAQSYSTIRSPRNGEGVLL
jgi:hypothetical protein